MKNVQLASDFRRMSSLIPTVFLCLCFQTSSTSEQETQAPKPEASLAVSVATGAEQPEVSIAPSTPKSRALTPPHVCAPRGPSQALPWQLVPLRQPRLRIPVGASAC